MNSLALRDSTLPTRLDVYRAFLASPSDVEEERRAALDLQSRFNAGLMRKHGRLVVFTIWEHIEPGGGRPQATINQLVDECDIFIGLLHERWGSPTGLWSSGFEEEFRRAEKRRDRTGSPEIALFFKSPAADRLAAPTDELRKVLDFRKSISESYLYREVKNLHDWREGLTFLLTQHAVPTTAESEQRGTTALAAELEPEPGPQPLSPDVNAIGVLREAMGTLTERQATVVRLYYFEGLTHKEVSEVLSLSLPAVRQERRRAIRALREVLDASDGNDQRRSPHS